MMNDKDATMPLAAWTDRVAYEQWIVRDRVKRKEAAEIEARKCVCPLCKELWS